MSIIQPTNNTSLIIDDFINYATAHLSTVSGITTTVSLYPPVGTPGPGILLWSGYTVTPATGDFDSDNAAAIERDINEEYPASQAIYEAQFETEEDARANNSQVTKEEALSTIREYKLELERNRLSGPLSPAPTDAVVSSTGASPVTPVAGPVGRGDLALFKKCGNGEWPALGTAPNFEVRETQNPAAKCPRYWYKVNAEYMKKNCTQIDFPTASGDKKITVHKDLAAIVKPVIVRIKAQGLQKYIQNCGGGLAVRNVTCGTRLSNHSWGTAIDMNTLIYPYGISFKADGIYKDRGRTKIRALDEFDRGFQKVAALFKSEGMTWLSDNDPMHVSIYE